MHSRQWKETLPAWFLQRDTQPLRQGHSCVHSRAGGRATHAVSQRSPSEHLS